MMEMVRRKARTSQRNDYDKTCSALVEGAFLCRVDEESPMI